MDEALKQLFNICSAAPMQYPPSSTYVPSPLPKGITQPRIKVLLPQSSRTFAVRRVSDSSSSDIQALDVLDRYKPPHTAQPSFLRIESNSGNEAETESSSQTSSGSATVDNKDQTVASEQTTEPVAVPTRPDLKNSHTTGQFLFTEEESSTQNLLGLPNQQELRKSRSFQPTRTNPPALGTAVMSTHTIKPAASQLDLKPKHDVRPLVTKPAPPPAMPVPVTPRDFLGLPKDLSVGPVLRPSLVELPHGPIETPLNGPLKVKKRRRLIRKARKVVLRRKVLSFLLGRDIAHAVHSSLDPTQKVPPVIPVSNVDGSMQPMPGPPIMLQHLSDTSAGSPHSFSSGLSMIGSVPPMNLDHRTNDMRRSPQMDRPRRVRPQRSKNIQRQENLPQLQQPLTLVERVKLFKSGKKPKPGPAQTHPPGSLAAGVQALHQRKSWKQRLRLQGPKKGVLNSWFKRRKPKQKTSPWKFWKSTVKTDRSASRDGKAPK